MNLKKNINRLFLMMTCIFSILLLLVSILACYFAYAKKKESFLASMDMAYSYMNQEYENLLVNYLQVYLPIWENDSSADDILRNYFSNPNTEDLTPIAKRELSDILRQMYVRDNRVAFIALYSDNRSINYIKYNDNNIVSELPNTFPWLSDMTAQTAKMEVYGARELDNSHKTERCFAICSSIPRGMGNGKILIGYHLDNFHKVNTFLSSALPSMHYYVTANRQLVFDSSGQYRSEATYFPEEPGSGLFDFQDQKLYVRSDYSGNINSLVVCTVSSKELFFAAHQDTPWIIGITLAFLCFSLFLYFSMNRSVSKEVGKLKEGLDKITGNDLNYRLPTDFQIPVLPEIAENINLVTSRLDESIRKAYYFELKQKDAQLAQLQATFNPHFLYNTLEMLRSKIYANGDVESAGLISDLSSIFRSFIGTKTFITLKEELVYSQKYLALLNARYGNKVTIRYSINSSLLDYGIIRNVFQIIIENFFVHGFDANDADSMIRFTGTFLDEETILLTVEDNGIGMSEEDLKKLNHIIEEPIRNTDKSYGLKNLNQRLKLFYGPDYGLHLLKNDAGGLTVQIKIRKMLPEKTTS